MSNALDIGREIVNRHKGKVISVSSIAATITVLVSLGINPLDIIVTYSSEYQNDMKNLKIKIDSLEAINRNLSSEVEHHDHIRKSQNFMLRRMLDSHMISMDEYDSSIHPDSHE